jgi:hypothetical protein
MNYWAKSDSLFEDGHYVEEWELQRFQQFSPAIQAFVREQAALGNKVRSIAFPTVFLGASPSCGPVRLPEGLAFFTPIFHTGVRVLDGDNEGVICCLSTGQRVYPVPIECTPNPSLQATASGRA